MWNSLHHLINFSHIATNHHIYLIATSQSSYHSCLYHPRISHILHISSFLFVAYPALLLRKHYIHIYIITRYLCTHSTHILRNSLFDSLVFDYKSLVTAPVYTISCTIGTRTITIRNTIRYPRYSLRDHIIIPVCTAKRSRISITYQLSYLHHTMYNSSTQHYIRVATRYPVDHY